MPPAPYEPGAHAAWLSAFRFGVDVRPRYCECDAQGHVSNVVYTTYLELSRLQYFKAAGDPEPGAFAYAHVTAEIVVRYVAACFYDEPLRVLSRLTRLGRSSALMDQAIVGDGDTIRATATVAIVRSRTGEEPNPWTPAQRATLERFEPGVALG